MRVWPWLSAAVILLIAGATSSETQAAQSGATNARSGSGFTVTAKLDDAGLVPGSAADRYLVVEVTAPTLSVGVRHPVDLSLVIDASGSMAADGKFTAAKQAAKALIGQLNPEDTLSVLTFSENAEVIMRQGHVDDPLAYRARIDRIALGGGTHLHAGLSQGFTQVSSSERQAMKRVVILSDGHANIGIKDPARLAAAAGAYTASGVTVSTLGLGLDFNEDVLLAMSKSGGGTYQFVDNATQLAESFRSELSRITQVAGREVSLDVGIGDHFELMEVYAHDASTHPMGFNVFLGDMHSGETRKIVARVRPSPLASGEIPAAEVKLSFADPDTGSTGFSRAIAKATIEANVHRPDEQATRLAAEAVMGWSLDQSVRSWESGDVANSGAALVAGRAQLQTLADRHESMFGFDDIVLEMEEELVTQEEVNAAVAPSTQAGEMMKKRRKLDALGYME